MRSRLTILSLALLAASVALSGCLWLAIPGLAYQGYEYEKDQKTTASHHSTHTAHRATPKPTPDFSDVE